MRSSSICKKIEVVFYLPKIEVVFQIGFYYIPECFLGQVLFSSSFFTTIPGGRPAGRADAGYTKNKANLSLQAKLDLKLRLSLAIKKANDG